MEVSMLNKKQHEQLKNSLEERKQSSIRRETSRMRKFISLQKSAKQGLHNLLKLSGDSDLASALKRYHMSLGDVEGYIGYYAVFLCERGVYIRGDNKKLFMRKNEISKMTSDSRLILSDVPDTVIMYFLKKYSNKKIVQSRLEAYLKALAR